MQLTKNLQGALENEIGLHLQVEGSLMMPFLCPIIAF